MQNTNLGEKARPISVPPLNLASQNILKHDNNVNKFMAMVQYEWPLVQ